MGIIRFDVAEVILRRALAIPDDAEIIMIFEHDRIPDAFVFYVRSDKFPPTPEGALPLEVSPVITVNYEKNSETRTIDFRIPK